MALKLRNLKKEDKRKIKWTEHKQLKKELGI